MQQGGCLRLGPLPTAHLLFDPAWASISVRTAQAFGAQGAQRARSALGTSHRPMHTPARMRTPCAVADRLCVEDAGQEGPPPPGLIPDPT